MTGTLRLDDSIVDALRHAVKVHEQAQKHFISGWAVFMYSTEVAEDGNGRDVFAVKGEDGVAEGAHVGAGGVVVLVGLLLVGDVALHGIVLQVVGRGYFGEQGGDHVNDVVDGHGANLVLGLAGRGAGGSSTEDALLDEGGDVGEVADMDDGLRGRSIDGGRQRPSGARGRGWAGRGGLEAVVVGGR